MPSNPSKNRVQQHVLHAQHWADREEDTHSSLARQSSWTIELQAQWEALFQRSGGKQLRRMPTNHLWTLHACLHMCRHYSGCGKKVGILQTISLNFGCYLKRCHSRKNSALNIRQPSYGLSSASNQLNLWLVCSDFIPTQNVLKEQSRVFLGEESITHVMLYHLPYVIAIP